MELKKDSVHSAYREEAAAPAAPFAPRALQPERLDKAFANSSPPH